jgi:hypothetical protein
MALLLAAALLPAAAAAQPGAGAAAVDAQRELVRSAVAPECDAATSGEEIVVCGRREEEANRRYRLAPMEGSAGAVESQAGGEQLAAMRAGSSRCSTVGRDQQCGGGLPLLAVAATLVRGIRALRARRD